MPFDAHENWVETTLEMGISDSATYMRTVLPPGYAPWPDPPFNLVLCPANENPNWQNAEIVRAVDVDPPGWIIQRGQEGTNARAHLAGARVIMSATAKTFNDIEAAVLDAQSDVEDLESVVLGLQSQIDSAQLALQAQVFGR